MAQARGKKGATTGRAWALLKRSYGNQLLTAIGNYRRMQWRLAGRPIPMSARSVVAAFARFYRHRSRREDA